MYNVGGKIVSVGNKFPEKKVKTLTFRTRGTKFIQSSVPIIQNNERFFLDFSSPTTVNINYGDGFSENIVTPAYESSFRIGFIADGAVGVTSSGSFGVGGESLIPSHTYQDGFSGERTVTFTIANPEYLIGVFILRLDFIGNPPIEMLEFKNNISITLTATNFEQIFEFLPIRLESYRVGGAVNTVLQTLPDSIFKTNLEILILQDIFNLSDNISSNFFKISQLSNTLEFLNVISCKVKKLPNEINDLKFLDRLEATDNEFDFFPSEFNEIIVLDRLVVGNRDYNNGELLDTTYPDMSNLINLRTLGFSFTNQETDVYNFLLPLVSLKTIQLNTFRYGFSSNQRFNAFIDSFYSLCIFKAFLNTSSSEAQLSNYPNQFRDISWGWSGLTQTGTIEAPSGFIQGSNNGNPINQGQKIYVLVNNYGHTVATS